MRNLFCTADRIGTETGGGIVTRKELDALIEFSQEGVQVIDQLIVANPNYRLPNSPYVQDYVADSWVLSLLSQPIRLAHFYSGAFGKTIWRLKAAGTKITQTVAAHDVNLSMEEFAKYGIPFDFPHLTIRDLWLTYIEGHVMADKVICPSQASKRIVESYGVRDAVVIPHGVVPPAEVTPLPCTLHRPFFDVGYLGQVGPDKGLIYLLEAWSKLNLTGHRLLIAGRDGPHLAPIWNNLGHKGEVEFMGWVEKPVQLYGRCSVYVQPSVTEGFGIEVLEAMAHGRPVIVSEGAGAADVVENGITGFVVPRRNPDAIADCIMKLKNDPALCESMGTAARAVALCYTWDKIIPKYRAVWTELMKEEEVEDDDCFACHGSRVCQMCRARTNKCEECDGTGVCQECGGG